MRISDWCSDVCSSDLTRRLTRSPVQDRSLRYRGVRWADIDGRLRLLVGGTVNSYIANPTFDPVAKPGSLFDWYRGNPKQQQITEAFGELEPLRPEYQDREVRLKVMEEQGLAGMLLFPTQGVGVEHALRADPNSEERRVGQECVRKCS